MRHSPWWAFWRHGFRVRSIRLVDPRLKGYRRIYVYQALLATAVLIVVLTLEDLLTNAAIFAAIASTAFVLFVTPHSLTATPRHVIGGHVVCVIIGGLFSLFLTSSAGEYLVGHISFLFDVTVALSVGVGILLMAMTDTEHAPAAGTALGMAAVDFSWSLIGVVLGSVIFMSATRRILLPRLRDLL